MSLCNEFITSAANLWKQFGPRPNSTKHWTRSGLKLLKEFLTVPSVMKTLFEKVDFGKKKADYKKTSNFPSRQIVNPLLHRAAFWRFSQQSRPRNKINGNFFPDFSQVYINKIFERKLVNIFLPISINICFGCLIQTVLLSAHNVCFGWEIRKLIFWYALLKSGSTLFAYGNMIWYDFTVVDMKSNFFVLCTNVLVFLMNYS